MVALRTDAFGLKSSKLAELDSTKFDEEPFFAPSVSENASRTPGALFSHRMHIPYTRGHSPVPNANAKKEKGSGANKESGVRVRGSRFLHRMPLKTRRVPEASCCRCRTSNLSKQEAGQKEIFSRPLICYRLLRSVGLCG